MGGNLLKVWNLPDRRATNEEYERIGFDVRTHLKHAAHPYNADGAVPRATIAPCIRDKDTHGDIDILFGLPDGKHSEDIWWGIYDTGFSSESFAEYIKHKYGFEPHRNSNVFSFPVEGIQVDVTFLPLEEFETAVTYTAWGDLGNLMGRVYHKMGLHYGHSGLQFWIRQGMYDANVTWSDSDHIYSKFILSRHPRAIFELGGFDYDRWMKGFDTEKDAFDFVINSKYFDHTLFALENLNHTNRTRNRKRGMYMRFIEYLKHLEESEVPKTYQYLSKEIYSLVFQDKFPPLKTAIGKYRFEHELQKQYKAKINGKIVAEWLCTTDGPLIGQVMKDIKLRWSPIEAIQLSDDVIRKYALHWVQ